jgi:hypothetical protein
MTVHNKRHLHSFVVTNDLDRNIDIFLLGVFSFDDRAEDTSSQVGVNMVPTTQRLTNDCTYNDSARLVHCTAIIST